MPKQIKPTQTAIKLYAVLVIHNWKHC